MKAIESTEQAAEVAKMYLEKRGYSEVKAVGELGKAVSLVATDPEARALAFVKVVLERDAASGFTPTDASAHARSEAEATAIEYPSSMENVPDARVRFDVLSLIAMGGGRVFIRHHINALGDD